VGLTFLGLVHIGGTSATELKPRTANAFQHYEELTEARMRGELANSEQFLFIDTLPQNQKVEEISRLKAGQVYIRSLSTKEDGKKIEIPEGLPHHWLAIAFLPGARLEQVLQVAQDYGHHGELFKPDLQRTELLCRDGEHFRVYYRLYRHSIVTVSYNTEFEADYTQSDALHNYSFMKAARIAEVRNAGEKEEREYPVGNDHGYLWRLNFYTRYMQVDDGVYVQIEMLSLSRTVPGIIAWMVNPYLKSIPREYLTDYLVRFRNIVADVAKEKESVPVSKE